MRQALVVVDMQNDFIDGALANTEAQKIVQDVADFVRKFKGTVYTTQDAHKDNYLDTQEGRRLPVEHCLLGTNGCKITEEIEMVTKNAIHIYKDTFGSRALASRITDSHYDEVYLCGVCTDICVISNAMLIKAFSPEVRVIVLEDLCAGVTPETHKTALDAMRNCQIDILNSADVVISELKEQESASHFDLTR